MTNLSHTSNVQTVFESLAHEHGEAIRRYFYRRVSPMDVSVVDDLLVETLTITWRRIADVPEDAALPWMLGVARRVLANAQRGHRRRTHGLRELRPRHQASAEAMVGADDALHRALGALSDDDRDILLAAVWDGLTTEQLAKLYDITTNAVDLRLSRARARFHDAFTNEA
jgi:RNA polymerase sigma-70 factor (ECF subfamily)